MYSKHKNKQQFSCNVCSTALCVNFLWFHVQLYSMWKKYFLEITFWLKMMSICVIQDRKYSIVLYHSIHLFCNLHINLQFMMLIYMKISVKVWSKCLYIRVNSLGYCTLISLFRGDPFRKNCMKRKYKINPDLEFQCFI